MNTSEKNWKVLVSLLPNGWREEALKSGAIRRLRGFSSPEVPLRTILLHVGMGYSLRETVVRARLAGFANVSDVALLGRMRKSEEWLRSLCRALLQESSVSVLERTPGAVRILDVTVVKKPGKTGSQWRILYSLNLPSLIRDVFEVTSTIGEGNGEALNRLPVIPNELTWRMRGTAPSTGLNISGNQVQTC
jgi:hypothetical protein